jgi:Rap1a immunity proteins
MRRARVFGDPSRRDKEHHRASRKCRRESTAQSVLVDQHGRLLLGICAPEKTTLVDYIRIIVQYAQRHPQATQGNAAALAVVALSNAFPGGNKQRT